MKLSSITLVLAAVMCSSTSAQDVLYDHAGAVNYDWFGWSVDGAGDVNSDGHADWVVGAPTMDPDGLFKAGLVTVYSGLDGSVLRYWPGGAAYDQFGWAVAGVGDVDGDGYDDVAASAVHPDIYGLNYVQVRSGIDGSIVYGWVGSASDGFGYSLSGAGDVDGDFKNDVIIGMPFGSTGVVYVNGTSIFGFPYWTFVGDGSGDSFGYAVSGGGDATGDGVPEILVGAPQLSNGGAGYARVFNGATGALVYDETGPIPGDQFGFSVDIESDIDGDGFADYVVGIPRASTYGETSNGRLFIYDGQFGFLSGSQVGLSTGDWLGYDVSTSDVNRDGYSDVIAGAPGDNIGGFKAGSISVYSGQTNSLIAKEIGSQPLEALGWSVAGAGMVGAPKGPNDKLEDFVAGGPGWLPATLPGVARVFAGAKLYVDVFLPEVPAGDTFTITIAEGDFPDFNLLFLTAVDGVPTLLNLFGAQPFSFATGTTEHTIVAPASLAGTTLTFGGVALLGADVVLGTKESVTIL